MGGRITDTALGIFSIILMAAAVVLLILGWTGAWVDIVIGDSSIKTTSVGGIVFFGGLVLAIAVMAVGRPKRVA
jgi:hypothetical protein